MPTNDRGTPIAGNHRPTPRIAQMIATRMGNDAQSSMWGTAPNLYRTSSGPSIEESQAALDNYRFQRDELNGPNHPDADLHAHADLDRTARYIGETIRMEKRGENFKPTQSYKDLPNY